MNRLIFLSMGVFLAACQPVTSPPQRPDVAAIPTAQEIQFSSLDHTRRLVVELPARKTRASLERIGYNNGVETWVTRDAISLSFKGGVLVASRGLGFDLMGADPNGTLDALGGRQEGGYLRQMSFLNGEHGSVLIRAECFSKSIGSERIGTPVLQRIDEQCSTQDIEFVNNFWLDPSGRLVQSSQWLSPELGYVIVTWDQ